jgi:DNA-binding response OmpR family regulator/tetratricopeptide (TPR) repeat protein
VPLRILIVEDDSHVRRILEPLVSEDPAIAAQQAIVRVVEDGAEALAELDRGPVDLVISDLVMPRMDGFTFCRRLRKHPNGERVPLITMSAIMKDPAQIEALRNETGAEFFAKPFQVRELMAAVRRCLGLNAPDSAPRVGNDTGPRAALGATSSRTPSRPTPVVGSSTAIGRLSLKKSSSSAGLQENSGTLDERGAAPLLLDLTISKVSGSVTLMRGEVRKEVFFAHGTPIGSRSNVRGETLGHFLVTRGVLTEAQHRSALQRSRERNERLGRVLIELGFLDEAGLLKQLAAQMRARIVSTLRWKTGKWSWSAAAAPPDLLQTPVDGARLVLAGLGKTAHPEEIVRVHANTRGGLRISRRGERCAEAFVRIFGAPAWEIFRREPRVEVILGVPELIVAFDALVSSGMGWIEPAASQASSSDEAKSTSEHAVKDLYEQLFGDDISEVRTRDSLVAAATTDTHDIIDPPTTTSQDPQAEALRREVLARYLAVQGKGPHEVLGLPPDATREEIEAAYELHRSRFRLERFAGVDLGRDYARLEELNQLVRTAYEALTSSSGATLVAQARSREAAREASMNADLLAEEAAQLIRRGAYVEAGMALSRAVDAAPEQADYHAQLAWATFLASGGAPSAGQTNVPLESARQAAAAAAPYLSRAFAIDPDCLEAHERAARIALATADDDAAIVHLEEVLDRAPANGNGRDPTPRLVETLASFEGACQRRGDLRRLERQYRRLIHRAARGSTDARMLWWRLAELYERLKDVASARVAYEVLSRLEPDDPRIPEALARLDEAGRAGDAWRVADELRSAWRAQPHDATIGLRLFAHHAGDERWDAAFCVAAALTCRGVANDEAAALFRRHRPRFLQRAQTQLAPLLSSLEGLCHSDENAPLGQLLSEVFAVVPPPPTPLPTDATPVGEGQLPDAFGRVLAYVCEQLDVPVPPVLASRERRRPDGWDLSLAFTDGPQIIATPESLAESDRVALAFRLGRLCASLIPGRAETIAADRRVLRAAVYGAMTLCRPDLAAPDQDGSVSSVRQRLSAVAGLAERLRPPVERLLAETQGQLSLSRHVRGLHRTADRVGLLLCGDPLVAVSLVREAAARATAELPAQGAPPPQPDEELIEFTLSRTHLAARDALGLSVAV